MERYGNEDTERRKEGWEERKSSAATWQVVATYPGAFSDDEKYG